MAKIFNGKVLFASAMQPTGAQPLDDRVVVSSYSDLVDATTFGDAKYLGMIVATVEEGKLYMLQNTDVTAEGAWKEIGADASIAIALEAENYTAAKALATSGNVGQIIYVKNKETEGEGDSLVEYSAGPYIVTGAGTISKLGVTSASGDIEGDVEDLKGDVGTLTEDVSVLDSSVKDLDASLKVVDSSVSDLIDSVGSLDTSVNYIEDVLDVKVGSGLEKNTEDDSLQVKIDPAEGNLIESSDAGLKVVLPDTVASKNDVKAVQDAVDAIEIPEVPEYNVAKLDTAEEGYAASYQLQKDGVGVGAVINIPKDMVVSSGVVRELTDDEITEERPQGVYVVLTLANATNDKLYIPANKLVDDYTGSDYIEVASDGTISVKYNDLKSALKTDFDQVYDAIGAAEAVASDLDAYKADVSTALADKLEAADLADYAKTEDVSNAISDAVAGLTDVVKSVKINDAEAVTPDENGLVSLTVDLTAYAKSEDVANNYVAKEDGKALSSNDFTNDLKAKLEGIAEGAEVNYIKSVGDNLAVDDAGNLTVDLTAYATTDAMNNALAAKLDASAKVNGVSFIDGEATVDAGDIALEAAITRTEDGEEKNVYEATASIQSVLASLSARIDTLDPNISGEFGVSAVNAGNGIEVTGAANTPTISVKVSAAENNVAEVKTDGVYVRDMRSYWENI